MQVFKKERNDSILFLLKSKVINIEFNQGNPATLTSESGHRFAAGCLNCQNKRCCFYNKCEVETLNLIDFPFDKNVTVCPVGALKIGRQSNAVKIDAQKCVKCGLCVQRCPIGALYFDEKGEIKLSESQDEFLGVLLDEKSLLEQSKMIDGLLTIKRGGCMLKESDDLFENIYHKLKKIESKNCDLMGRNLLIGLGYNSGKRRTGDVYTRMDAVYQTKLGKIGAVEIEFGRDTLDASRAILDDIATMSMRYQIRKNENFPLVICLQLPNARQGYWQVIKDISNVESIKIQTLSIGAMMVLIWNFLAARLDDLMYYIDFDNKILRDKIEDSLERKINVSEKFMGIFEPIK